MDYQHLSHVGIACFVIVHLQFALAGIPAPRLQSGVTTCIAALAEELRILQRQQVGQGDQSQLP
jgi:hypothetical protein